MKPEKISDAMGLIDDKLVTSAQKMRVKRKNRRAMWIKICAAAACVALIVTAVFGRNSEVVTSAYAVCLAKYPSMVQCPDEEKYYDKHGNFDDKKYSKDYDAWRADRYKTDESVDMDLDGFFAETIRCFLSDTEGENSVYSPVNVYMALCMLAEITDSGSRQQILDLLGVEDIETLRRQANAVWNEVYNDDGRYISVLANSLWLNEDISYVKSTLETLAEDYYASTYQGEMGSEEFNEVLQGWLNEQTKELLKEQAQDVEMSTDTIMALASTIYFRAKWGTEFNDNNTEQGIFHATGGDVTCDFMKQRNSRNYYWSDKFSAMYQRFENGGKMWLILPDEGIDAESLLGDGETMDLFLSEESWENEKYLTVNLSMPKFDVASDMDLKEGLKELGVTEVFDADTSDFSPITEDLDGTYVSEVKHAARVTVDEEGCTAAAFTVIMTNGTSAPPEEEVDFVLDRPFLFVITGETGLPLFAGIVNNPS